MLKPLLSKFEKIALGVIVIAVVVLIFLWKRNSPDTDVSARLTTEQKLLDQNADLMKRLIQEKDDRIAHLESDIVKYNLQLERNATNKINIIKRGNEKVANVSTYTDADILRYLSNLDSADIATPIPDSK